MLLVSWWVLYRTAAAATRMRLGGSLAYLLNAAFLLGIAAQTGFAIWQQVQRLTHRLQPGPGLAAALSTQAAESCAVFALDVLGMLLLMPPAMIRADGIAGRQRAAVDTELWLTLPLSGPQRVVARLGQATFFLTFLGFFLLGHFLGPAVAFAPSRLWIAPLFLTMAGAALLTILGGGVILYALARRYLSPTAQGRLIAWTGLGMLPISFAYFGAAQGKGGVVAARLGRALVGSPLGTFLVAAHEGRGAAALGSAALLLGGALGLGALGYVAATVLFREATDDLAPLGGGRRYPTRPGEGRRLTHLRKDLLLRFRDPTHRGALIASVLASFLVVLLDLLTAGSLTARWQQGGSDPQLGLSLGCFAVGMAVLVSASQWVPLEARTLDWLRASGIEPKALLLRKGLAASVEALVLSLPVSGLLLLRGGRQMAPFLPLLWIFALGLCWFVLGDTAARFPEARRDTRPVQLRTLYAGYLVMLSAAVVLPLSPAAAAAALCLLGMGALGRLDAGVDALVYLDEARDRPAEVRFADAWTAGAAAAITQGVVLLTLVRSFAVAPPLAALCGYSASALLLGAWSLRYLGKRLPRVELARLLGPPASRRAYLEALGLGCLSLLFAAAYLRLLRGHVSPEEGAALPAGLPFRVLLALIVTTIDPLTEELFFRGWIQQGLQRRFALGRWALLLQAVLFTLLHPVLSYAPVLVLGLLCGVLARRHGSLRPAMLLHALHNAGPAIGLLLSKGTP